MEQLQKFFEQLPPELQQKIMLLPEEKQQEVLMQLMQRGQQSQYSRGGKIDFSNYMYSPTGKLFTSEQQYDMYNNFYNPLKTFPIQNIYFNKKVKFEEGGETQEIPVEAEKDENVTVQDGQQPQVEGGYLEQQSHNPVTGQSTYEIPDNEHNNAHGESGNGSSQEGVNMELTEGDVINSNKTKIPVDFKIYGKNFKNKTFKEASDYLAKQETKIQDDFAQKVKEGKTDKVSDGALQIMLAKLGKNRDELNELQEQVLESKKQNEVNEAIKSGLAEYGKVVLEMDKAKEGLNVTLDRYLNYKVTEKPVVKAAEGLNASLDKFSKFADKVTSNPKASLQDIMSAYKQSGLSFNPKESTAYYKPTFQPINGSQIVGDFKTKIAQKETGAYKNPYIAIAGVSEQEAATKSFAELRKKAASTAIGKYQFVWNIHKNDIARVTGIKTPDDFRHNPQAQEQFMDWFRDTQLLPQATEVKQKYQIPMSIEEIMAGIHLEGKGSEKKGNGFIGKYLSGQLKKSTMAGSFKNASTSDYMSGFEHGGKAKPGVWNNFEPISYNRSNDYPDAKEVYDSKDIPKDGKIYIWDDRPFQYKDGKTSEYYSPEEIKKILEFRGKQESEKTYTPTEISNPVTNMLYNTDSPYREFIRKQKYQVGGDEYKYGGYAKDGFNFSTWAGDKVIPGLNKADYTADDLSFIAKTYFPNQQFKSNKELQEAIIPYLDENFGGYQNYVKPITPFADKKTPLPGALYDDKFGDDWNAAIKLLKENSPVSVPVPSFKFDPYITKDINDAPIDDRNTLNRSKLRIPSDNEEVVGENQTTAPTTQGDKASWMDKLKYGMRESLPYLRNLALMQEEQFNPVLQQKPHDNPYDNMRTDYSIQANLNDNQRALLTTMADSRGNPSVRNARLAQLAANTQNINNQLYTQKYNQELNLENQKQVGQSQYRNQLDDTNRNLRKQFEQEVLQTKEVARQQKNMAIDNMMNTYLRKAEEDQALKLSLMNTNWDWDKFKQELKNNPEKARAEFMRQQYIANNKGKYGLKVKKS